MLVATDEVGYVVSQACQNAKLENFGDDREKRNRTVILHKIFLENGYNIRETKASIVERFNRTLKSRLYRYFTAANTTQYVDILPLLVQRYNKDVHRSIGMAPKDVNVKNEAEVWQRLSGQVTETRRRGRLKVGDKVRLSERVKTFKKGYLRQWTEKVFRDQTRDPG